jgi:PAS domain S-box-containing protein
MEAVRQSEQHLEMISNTVPALISYVDRDLCYRTCNEAYLKWFGVSREDVIGKPVREILGEEAWSAVRSHIEASFADETVDYEIEVNYLRAGRRWIHAVYTPHRNAVGEVIGLVVMVTDITGRKRAEEADEGSGGRSTPPRDSTCLEQGGRGAALTAIRSSCCV